MQAIKRVKIGDCSDKDIISYHGEVGMVYFVENTYHMKKDGEYIEFYGLISRINHKIRHDRYVDLINIEALKDKQYDPSTANVFADFLEENGHDEAANLLRKEFPLLVSEVIK